MIRNKKQYRQFSANQINKLSKSDSQQGFSLIDVVITLFIIGVMLLLFQVVSQTVVLNKYNRYKEVALRIADNKIQELKSTPYASLPASGSFADSKLSSIPQGVGSMVLTDEVANSLKLVTVTVTWRNPNSTGNQQVSLSTYVSSGGIGQ